MTTFAQSENSNFNGRPVILYDFMRGTTHWRYAQADRDITLGVDDDGNPIVYTATSALTDAGVSLSGNATTDTFEITIPSSTAIVQLFAGTAPLDEIYCFVRRYHPGDTDSVVEYVGEISSVGQTTPYMSKIAIVSIGGSLRREGVRIAWERSCPWSVYSPRCGVVKENFAVVGVIAAIDGNVLIVTSAAPYADQWFAGGYFTWTNGDDGLDYRGLEASSGQTVTVFGMADGLSVGTVITMYPGCARTTTVCIEKFNNLVNYGGYAMMPGKSPFDGSNPY